MNRPARRHALYVAWGFPPAKSGGVFRMMETANVLVEEGWDVTVLACDVDDLRRFAGVDLSTLAGVDPRVRVVRIPMDLGPFETDLHRWDDLRVNDPGRWIAQYRARVAAGFPTSVYALWEEPLVEAARSVHAEREVHLVIASGGPFVCFSAGQALRREHGVPFVMDYRDSWSLQQFTGERLHPPGTRAHTIEDQLLVDVSEVWFVNGPMQRWHEDVYPHIVGKTRVVTNGYDAEAVAGLPMPTPGAGGVRFGFLGTVTAAVPLAETLAGYHLARTVDPQVRESSLDFYGYLGFYHTPDETLRQRILAAGADNVQWRGPLPKARVASAYAELDALVLTFGGTRFVTSGKVFEYMATARPIVSVVAPENAVREVLEGYPLWFQAASLESPDVAEAFVAAGAAVQTGHASDPAIVDACREHADLFERRRCLRPAIHDVAVTAEFARDTAVVSSVESDGVAYCGRFEPAGLRAMVGQAGRRLLHVPPADPSGNDRLVPDSLDDRRAELGRAEPGTIAGRLRRLYEVVAEDAAGAVDEQAVTLAEQVLATGAGALITGDDVPAAVSQWLARVVPGMPVAALIGTPPTGGTSDAAEWAGVGGLLVATPALRLRRSQDPIDPDAARAPHRSGAASAIATVTRATRPAGTGTVVLTSSPVEAGSPVMTLAEGIAADSGDEVVVLALAREELPLRGHARRRDGQMGRVGIITLPAPTEVRRGSPGGGTQAGSGWRHREGAWRDRRVTVQAPLPLRAAQVRHAKRIRARAAQRRSAVDKPLIAVTRLGTGVFRALDAADRLVDAAGRQVSDLHDRLELRRHGAPAWETVFPDEASRSAGLLPLLERLDWDTIHVADPAALTVARQAVEERRRTGRPARWVRHLDREAGVMAEAGMALRGRRAHQALIEGDTGEQGSDLPTVVRRPSPAPEIAPWPRDDLPAVIGIGPYNMAGQGWAWAKAIEGVAPGVRTEVVSLERGSRSHMSFRGDISVPLQTFDTDLEWMEQFEAHVLDTWTHAVLEGGRSVLGSLYGRENTHAVTVLREAGIKVGLVFHGSDLRDPRQHVTRTPWSPFTDPHDDLVQRLQRRHDLFRGHLHAYEGLMWVSTPDLLVDLPGAQWLPVVVDTSRWATDEPCLERPVPVVVHVPSLARIKGTESIEAGLSGLMRDGVIDYRRIEGVTPDEMPGIIASADIVLDQFALGSYGVAAVEAMAAGRVVLGHIMSDVREHCPDLPIVEATPETIDQVLRDLVGDRSRARDIAAAGERYAREWHDGRRSGELLVRELRPVAGGTSRGRLRITP